MAALLRVAGCQLSIIARMLKESGVSGLGAIDYQVKSLRAGPFIRVKRANSWNNLFYLWPRLIQVLVSFPKTHAAALPLSLSPSLPLSLLPAQPAPFVENILAENRHSHQILTFDRACPTLGFPWRSLA
jgi:hypothetical protein